MRMLIVDDHQVVWAGVRALLESDPEIEVCGEGVDGLDAIAKAHELLPDAVVMDVSMPNLSGIAILKYYEACGTQQDAVGYELTLRRLAISFAIADCCGPDNARFAAGNTTLSSTRMCSR